VDDEMTSLLRNFDDGALRHDVLNALIFHHFSLKPRSGKVMLA
jgi:hypothetical protein